MTSPSSPVTPRAARAREGGVRREREEVREEGERASERSTKLISRGSLDNLERCRRPIEGSRPWASQGLTFSATWFRGRRGLSVAGGGRAQRLARPTPETRKSPQCPASPPPSSRPSLPRRHPGARASPPRDDRARPSPPPVASESPPRQLSFLTRVRSLASLRSPRASHQVSRIPLARRRAHAPPGREGGDPPRAHRR
jgi:hypothetical protein